ncbi:hypothetical protein HY572_06395 [Candidatus Micrarchaeota archaeon]|nr:hypothetical protein [Candidatus Micrarchaeota archaeon]
MKVLLKAMKTIVEPLPGKPREVVEDKRRRMQASKRSSEKGFGRRGT